MQTEVSTLPVVCSDGPKRLVRNSDINTQSSSAEVKNHNTCKNSSFFVSNRKQLHPLVGGPYRNSMRVYALSEPVRSTNKTTVGQRVMSAKMLRVKQLQNQLTDAHYHLNELANENRLLKALQKRQDSALKKYEGTHAELPRIINSHHEELKVLQLRHKKLRTQHKHTCDLLKEKENEIHSLQSQNKHLMQLSKDRHLEERDKLQMRVSDLNFRIEQQQETIQTLNRKLALESKSLKHQLNTEVAKHKETQRNLTEALEKLKNLEDLLDNREKRLYYNGRLPVCNKGKPTGHQSLTNLGQHSESSNTFKHGSKCRGYQNESETGSLPKLTKTESNEGKTIPNLKLDQNDSIPITETMSSLQQVRKFRLQKSYSRNGSAGLGRETEKCDGDDESTARNESNSAPKSSSFEKLRSKRTTLNEVESEDEELKKFVNDFEMTNGKGPYKLPKQLMKEFGYSSDESETDTKDNGELDYESKSLASKSRDLHTRLISDRAIITDAVPEKSASSIHSSSTSESESESRNKIKSVSTIMKDYLKLRGRSSNGDENSNLSLDDFLKLDINATGSELEMERLREAKGEQTEKAKAPTDGLLLEGYETSQQRLLTITKSWTELQAKIKREREISESQLKTLNEGNSSASHIVHEKLIRDDLEKNSSTSSRAKEKYEKSYDMSGGSQSVNDFVSCDSNIEIPRAQQNGRIEDSPVSVDDSKTKTEIGHRTSTYVKESEKSLTHIEDSPNITNHEISENLSTDTYRDFAKEEYNSENVEHLDEDVKLINYNKEKLLAAMKAIDDNENIEFVANRKHQGANGPIRSQSTITENLYRGLPSHARKKDDILKEIFSDVKSETKLRATCSKLH